MAEKIHLSEFDVITFQFDGNNNDRDDISALPIAAALAKSAGLENKTTFFFNNNLSEPNQPDFVAAMRKSAAFAEKLGINTYDYQANLQNATNELVNILDSGKKVLAIEGGPMEAIYRALERVSPANRGNIVLLSHSSWNENRNLGSRPGGGKPRTWSDLRADFPEVKRIDIRDQNGPGNTGFNSANWKWLDNTNNPVLKEARDLMGNAKYAVNDPSDAGMLFYALTNNESGDPGDAQAFFNAKPPSFSSSPSPTPGGNSNVYLAEQGQVIIEAENTKLQGDWKQVTVGGKQSVLWDANQDSYGNVPTGQTLSYSFETDEAGQYSISMHSARLKSAMNAYDSAHADAGNDIYVSVINEQTGAVVQKPTKLFTNLGSSDGELRWGNTFDANHQKSPAQVGLDANTQYRLEVSGRSDGYVLDRITLSNDGFLKNAAIAESKTKGNTPAPTPQPNPNPTPAPNRTITIEAEAMQLSGEYQVESNGVASGGKGISLRGGLSEGQGTAGFTFNGPTGDYNIKISYFDENDGVGRFSLKQGNQQVAGVTLDQQLGSPLANAQTLTSTEVQGIAVNAGDRFSLTGFEDGTATTAEHVRIDKIEFTPVSTAAIRINAGGGAFTDSNGNQWSADQFFQGGKLYSTGVDIASTQDDALFQTERFGKNLSYAIPVDNGRYQVNLNFDEIYFNGANQRVFDVTAENTLAIDNLDIYAEAGGKGMILEKILQVDVQDGMLNLDFNSSVNNAKVSGIEILPAN